MKPEIICKSRRFLDRRQGCRLLYCGIKHSGKSSLARRAAAHLRWDYADSDELIMQSRPSSDSVRSFYQSVGKAAFMEAEYDHTLLHLQSAGSVCLALGGGAADNPQLLECCRKYGVLIFLDAPEQLLYERIVSGGIPPFLSADNPKESFRNLYERRRKVYLQHADVRLSTGGLSLDDAAAMLLDALDEIIARYYGRQ